MQTAEEERFTRIKHDHSFPQNAIHFCLDFPGISPENLDYVVFYEKPLVKFERILMTSLELYPKTWRVFPEAMVTWLMKNCGEVHGQIVDKLGINRDECCLLTTTYLTQRVLSFVHHLMRLRS